MPELPRNYDTHQPLLHTWSHHMTGYTWLTLDAPSRSILRTGFPVWLESFSHPPYPTLVALPSCSAEDVTPLHWENRYASLLGWGRHSAAMLLSRRCSSSLLHAMCRSPFLLCGGQHSPLWPHRERCSPGYISHVLYSTLCLALSLYVMFSCLTCIVSWLCLNFVPRGHSLCFMFGFCLYLN